MPGENIQDWSTTAATNASADTSIGWAEGQARASVNDSARSMMAAVAKWRNLLNGSITTGGTANAQTFNSGLTYTAVPTGINVKLLISAANTGAATLNMDGIGGVAILNQAGDALTGGELIIGAYREFVHNGTNWILVDAQGHPGVAQAHVVFNGAFASPAVINGYNVSSITKVGTGQYTINFATPFAAVPIIGVGTAINIADGGVRFLTGPFTESVSTWRAAILDNTLTLADADRVSLVFYGLQ